MMIQPKSREKEIENRIHEIKEALARIGSMRPGSLTRQSRGGGKTYWQLSYTHAGKGRTEYVREECVQDIQREIEEYGHYKALTDEWIALSIERSRLQKSASQLQPPGGKRKTTRVTRSTTEKG